MTIELRNEPQQKRSSVTLAKITDAARVCAERRGVDRFTTADVAEQAGVSIGTVYRYFDDRVALVELIRPGRAVADEVLAERARQVAKGYTAEHDDERGAESLLSQAEGLAFQLANVVSGGDRQDLVAAVALGIAALEVDARRHEQEGGEKQETPGPAAEQEGGD